MLTKDDLVVDRIISGEDGGRYIRSNIRPHCPTCSGRSGQRRTVAIVAAKRADTRTDHFHDDDGRYTGPISIRSVPADWPLAQGWNDPIPDWAMTA